ncbi:MAG: hypothetical protein IT454_04620 [Planctomycetes bacterium]|nr:hypothetical protein [Planctomycetota bacterium]
MKLIWTAMLMASATSALPAQTWDIGDAQRGGAPPQTMAPTASWSDDFNRADGAIGGSWTVLSGTWAVSANQGQHGPAVTHEIIQHSLASSSYASAVAELDVFDNAGSVYYTGIHIGLGGSDAILVKLQHQGTTVGQFTHIGLYHKSGTIWNFWSGTGTGFAALSAPFTSGRLRVYCSNADTLVAEIDTDFDGAPDQSYSRTGVAALAPNFGTSFGIAGYGQTTFDNFRASDTRVQVLSGNSPYLRSYLDFDNPFVASGPISPVSPVFYQYHDIGSVTPFGNWYAAGDTITSGSNDSGQSLVVQGAATLAVAGVGEALSQPAAGAGFEIQLNVPTRELGFLFVDQAGMSFDVELLAGGISLGHQQSVYASAFPAPPLHVALVDGCTFDRVRITFLAGTGGVGLDIFRVDTSYFEGNTGGALTGTGGAYPTTLPGAAFESSFMLPWDARAIERVSLLGLTHTWVGDVSAVLFDPTGAGHMLFNRIGLTGGTCCGSSYDFNGHVHVVESGGALFPTNADITTNVYNQWFGTWPSGTNGISNTPLSQIPVIPGGVYTLRIYDWYASADVGALSSWYVFGRRGDECLPFNYCAAGSTSNGCIPRIAANAHPRVGHGSSCVIVATNVEGQKNGLLFYGLRATQSPWCAAGGSSFLCVKPPTQRTLNQSTGGTAGACNGALVLDWSNFQTTHPFSLGNPFTAGDVVFVQGWFRDPAACKTTSLTGGLGLEYQP